ncbi:MAG: aminotransferase class V-fold PLP-dependent enzyme [Clostridiales bacterium]|jgi:cysteine desulfurase family protein|nr:aminotransferase class V-fold PLP-dependent enzyme [Clostridiales bacterium]
MIYLDNAATTLKKPYAVRRECARCLRRFCANSGRGGHKSAMLAAERIYACRENLAALFHATDPSRVIFTANATAALNIAVKGILTPGAHAVISGMEHNSVLRPVVGASAAYTVAPADETGLVTAASVENALRGDTALIAVTHASNVTGTVNPIFEIGQIAAKYQIPFLVDAAQSAGVLPIDVQTDNISLLAFPGHKALYGPTGTGGLYISPAVSLRTLTEGGTGSASESDSQPEFLPDRFESGTLNTVGIVGLNEGVKFVMDRTVNAIRAEEVRLADKLAEGIARVPGVTLYGGKDRVGIVTFTLAGRDSVDIANTLDGAYRIASRSGLHCAPLAHKSIGTFPNGAVRLSVGCFTTENEVDRAAEAVKRIARSGVPFA